MKAISVLFERLFGSPRREDRVVDRTISELERSDAELHRRIQDLTVAKARYDLLRRDESDAR